MSAPPIEVLLGDLHWARRLASSLVADSDAADDAVQDTFLAALRAPPDLSRPVRGWLATVMRNALSSGRLAERRRRERARAASAGREAATPSAEDELGRLQTHRLLVELVESLPDPYRQTIFLRYFEERSAADIARAIGVPEGTVRWRLKVALDQLRERLDQRAGGDRTRWRALLLPLADRSPALPSALVSKALLLPAAAIAGIVLAIALSPSALSGGIFADHQPAVDGTAGAAGRASVLALPPAGPARVQPPAAVTIDGCHRVLEDRRAELSRLEERLWADGDIPRAYQVAPSNPRAEIALLPAFDKLLALGGAAGLPHRTECRGRLCRLVVILPASTPLAALFKAGTLRDSGVFDHARRDHGIQSRFFADPITGQPMREAALLLQLDPSNDSVTRSPAARPPAPPPSLAACQSTIAELEQRLAAGAAPAASGSAEAQAERALRDAIPELQESLLQACRREHPLPAAPSASSGSSSSAPAPARSPPSRGWGQLRYTLSPDDRAIAFTLEGSAAGTPFGRCVEAEIRRLLTTIPVPRLPVTAVVELSLNFDLDLHSQGDAN